jgi:hypothetical protein
MIGVVKLNLVSDIPDGRSEVNILLIMVIVWRLILIILLYNNNNNNNNIILVFDKLTTQCQCSLC